MSTEGVEHGLGFIAYAKRTIPSLYHDLPATIKNDLIEQWGVRVYNSNGRRGLTFPPLTETRAAFEARYGVDKQCWSALSCIDWTFQDDVPRGSKDPD